MAESLTMKLSPVFLFHPLLISVLVGSIATQAQYASGQWSLIQDGHSGVSALELAVVSETTVMIFDKVEHNPLQTNGHVAWGAELNLVTRTVRPLNPASNTWCGTGSFLSNGTMVSSAGTPVLIVPVGENGLAAIRLFDPCEDGKCDVVEDQRVRRMASLRWYTSSARLEDGSVLLFGGSWDFGIINNATIHNPTYEFFPPKNIHGMLRFPSSVCCPFLQNTLNDNYFPFVITLPDGNLFIAANTQAMIFDWKTNKEVRSLPGIPNGVRISAPLSAGATLLPLTPENNYTPEVLICGGSTLDDDLALWQPGILSSQSPTSDQCVRMVLNDEGIAAGWQVEHMPEPRIMAELILLPDGRVTIVNGAHTGFGSSGGTFVRDPIGQSDSDHPAFTPALYDPTAPLGRRFTQEGLPTSEIPRLYHSTSSLTPNGTILLAGSNPNLDVETHLYPTEYRLEWLSPPYMGKPRPTYTGLPKTFDYNAKITFEVDLPTGAENVSVVIMDFGFATHGVHMDQRLVGLVSELSDDKTKLTVTGPPSATIYSPGPAYVFVLADGVPSFGSKTLIGTGAQPPLDEDALANVLSSLPLYWDKWTTAHPACDGDTFQRSEHNPLQTNGHVAWGAELNLVTRTVRPLNPASNTWCGTGSFLSNGTMVSSGGTPVLIVPIGENGLAAIRLFDPCEDGKCDVFEDQRVRRMGSLRWYPSSVRLEDGSVLVFGAIDNSTIINPTYEFYPPKNIHGHNGTPIYSPFLQNTLIERINKYEVFLAFPMVFGSAGATLLPLTPENSYTPEVLICGGSTLDDDAALFMPGIPSSQSPASDQCVRMILNEEGIAAGWQVEHMPEPRIMVELILLPDGRVTVVNGAQTGIAGYGYTKDQVGEADQDHPALTPALYDPTAPLGERFTQEGLPTSPIPRLYHSTSSLTPNGTVLLAGSNPNGDVETRLYPTEYRLEWLSPPYMEKPRPTYTGLPKTLDYNAKITFDVDLPTGAENVSVVIMDFGFATHGVHMDQRLVGLVSELSHHKMKLTVTGSPSPTIYSPGPAFVFVLADGVPSFGAKTLIGTGAQPPLDEDALANVLSSPPLYWDEWTAAHPGEPVPAPSATSA
ncbi:hypothetical protein D9758_005222 [Tetrapyrgos nigripes]|uniref:Copper radical oxidase n=1 Tax=Tetrapyrgos nigripes TaxID=182062 RepID=A0A8H5GWV5_9AGAR|nr:hypothetical protein D9758_005222 [Tetrapyrgos nigripes]